MSLVRIRLGLAATLAVANLALPACQDSGNAGIDGGAEGGGSDGGDASASACTVEPLIEVFQTRCTNSGCHAPGGQSPELTLASLQAGLVDLHSNEMPYERLVVPGDPMSSWIYRKVSGMQGDTGGALMPLGAATPTDVVPVIEAWIRAGAPTHCDTDAGLPPPMPTRPDPNNLDQGALFSCASPTPASSPARIRRIDQPEWTHAVGKPLNGTWWGSTAFNNPFIAPSSLPYSTYAEGVTIDPATFDLYTLVLPEAPANWDAHDPALNSGDFIIGLRTYPVYDDRQLGCIYSDAAPTDACIDYFVDKFLRVGVLSRAPTDGERSRLRAFLVESIAAEGGDVTKRQQTLLDVEQAEWLTSGALFRPEMGAPVPNDPAGRRRLTNDELALALGGVLSTHRPGSGIQVGLAPTRAGDPDWETPENGWLQKIRAAADNGTIQDPAVIRQLLGMYQGGTDAERRDILFDTDSRRIPARGQYWLAPRIAGFFREWLGYGPAGTIFKDTAGATSQFDVGYTGEPIYEPSQRGYVNLQNGYYGYESSLVQQMDDTIARTVLDSAASRQDVFRALLTTRLWHLPSDVADSNGQACGTDADCTATGYTSCLSLGVCGNSVSGSTSMMDRVYNVAGIVPDTVDGRWVTMPAGERAGVLTHPAWLAAHGDNFEDDASLIKRGHWVREKLFCQSVPGLENVMVEARLVARSPTLSARDRVHQSIETGANSSTCLGCHGQMNSLGYPFELFNHAGFVRVIDHGHQPDGSTTITNLPDPALNHSFANAVEFAQAIADSPYARRCFIRQAFRYFAGRDETAADACTLTAMEQALNNGSFFDMLAVLVTSDTFLYRTDLNTTEGGSP